MRKRRNIERSISPRYSEDLDERKSSNSSFVPRKEEEEYTPRKEEEEYYTPKDFDDMEDSSPNNTRSPRKKPR